jgi:predicted amidohydrolase
VTVTKTPDRLRPKTRLLAWVDPADAPALMAKYSGVVVGIKAGADNSGAAVKAAGNGIVLAEGPQSLRRGDIVIGALSRTGTSGVLFDTGPNLRFASAKKALGDGFLPDTISTGIDAGNVLLPRVNMMTTMSELLNLGMSVDQLIERATVNAARAIRHPELGTLSDGAPADIALFQIEKGKFGYTDADRATMVGDQRLRCVLTVRNGAVVWDSEGLSAPDVSKAGPYSNFK